MSDDTVPRPGTTGPRVTEELKAVLVTGSSSGIGLASVVAMSARGWEVFATMRDSSRSAPLTSALGNRPGPVHVLQLDLTDKHSVETAMAEVAQRTGGRLDALVHNAGAPGAGFFVDGGPDRLRETMETNLFGPAELTAAALPALSAARGRIVVVPASRHLSACPVFRPTPRPNGHWRVGAPPSPSSWCRWVSTSRWSNQGRTKRRSGNGRCPKVTTLATEPGVKSCSGK